MPYAAFSAVFAVTLDTPASITTTTLPAATVGTPYATTVATTGVPAPALAVTTGSLPAGLVLDPATGAITGTPAAPGVSSFTITAASIVSGIPMTTSRGYSLTVTASAGSGLANTGLDQTAQTALIAIGLFAVGAIAVLSIRRVRRTTR